MQYLLTTDQMKQVDNYTSEYFLLASPVLMERAALAVCEEIEKRFSDKSRVCIVCGNGNNGGDGYALGRILLERGYQVDLFRAKNSSHCSEGNQLQTSILSRLQIPVRTDFPQNEYDIIVDAILGTGFHKKEKPDIYDEWIQYLNHMNGYKIAIDISSGLDSNHGAVFYEAFLADLTVTFAFLKRGHLLHEGKQYSGTVVCKNIGISPKGFGEHYPDAYTLEKSDVAKLLPKRALDGHKGTFQKAGIIAGNKQIGGCAVLAAKACMRMGVGYTKVITDEENKKAVLYHVPEALIYSFLSDYTNVLSDCSCIAIGPGIGTGQDSYHLLETLLQSATCKLVIDADAINLIAGSDTLKGLLKEYTKHHDVILTPHKKELERFCGYILPTDYACLHQVEYDIAKDYGIYLVCKDSATRVYTPDGKLYINSSGNHGMGTAGSGDVLTGMLAGLAAQNIPTKTSATLGVFIHGLCGDYIKDKNNAYSLNASDLIEALKYVLRGDYENE